ncbi:DEAD/DEAH box helicase [Bacillus sp. FJAT-49705]|uniref:DEAD/DEAH box helicase n=1 Tax=Cytobacillus citreus TaxID=2833586 RepID=A0ABS5NP22_9BACI|nr:DEAD/DEAH box helicase [Cytobacillus citreus]MBS4189577.1 DEAD/DEAH box helicase [Cytobacillus citreus]
MKQLETTYRNAVESTKSKIIDDLNKFLGMKDKMPSFEEYITNRGNYVDQIWINVWLNKSTSISRLEKKMFLKDKGYETEHIDRKVLDHLFRTEMRTYIPFDANKWLNDIWNTNNFTWEVRYKEAREKFLQKLEEERIQTALQTLQDELGEEIISLIEKNEDLLYLYVRHFVSCQFQKDLNTKKRYQLVDTFALEEKLNMIGRLEPDSYKTLSDFFEELTGDIRKTRNRKRTYFEYETYYNHYEDLVSEYLTDILPSIILKNLPASYYNNEQSRLSKETVEALIEEIIIYECEYLANGFIHNLQHEFITDLLNLANIPFDPEKHNEILHNDLAKRERLRAEELAEAKRKKEEEKRMIVDIFGQEYQPSIERNIRYILHIGETNTGKTHHALEKMKAASSGIYLAPLRLLALEVYDKLNEEGTLCSLKTGEEEKLIPEARHISSTVEMFHEKDFYECIVIDEAQMLTDKDRGFSWYKAITKANAAEVHIIGSQNAKEMILQLLGESNIELNEYHRDIPLEVEKREFKFSRVEKGDALICFSRKRVLETASRLENSGHSVSMIYGSMPPETRKKQVHRFIKGETSIIVATDAIGMGLNLPIRRVVFLENEKFDGEKRRVLTSQEVKQIAGRAGRKGIYNIGKVAFTSNINRMWNLLISEDKPIRTFAVAPTSIVFERFQNYYRDLENFFELWEKFESPKGTKKAALLEERILYEKIRGTEIEAKFSINDLYSFLHLPFSKKEPDLIWQWEKTMYALIHNTELPEPQIKKRNLEELELTYKAIGLHLLFLYRLDRRTEAIYWERIREEISDQIHTRLKTDVKKIAKKCHSCGKQLHWDHKFQICNACYERKYRNSYFEY